MLLRETALHVRGCLRIRRVALCRTDPHAHLLREDAAYSAEAGFSVAGGHFHCLTCYT
jgi:hypothetical protein